MPWSSRFASTSAKVLVRQLMAIIQRDARAALDAVGGSGTLPAFTDYCFTEFPVKQFPALVLRIGRTEWRREESPLTRLGTHTVVCAVAVQDQEPEYCAELLEDYMEAMNRLFESVQGPDWLAALPLDHPMFSGGSISTAGIPSTCQVHSLTVMTHDYSALAKTRDGFATAGVIALEIETEENLST